MCVNTAGTDFRSHYSGARSCASCVLSFMEGNDEFLHVIV